MTAPDVTSLRARDQDFAEYGCDGCGEYKRCADMSERFESLLDEVERLREAAARVEALYAKMARSGFYDALLVKGDLLNDLRAGLEGAS